MKVSRNCDMITHGITVPFQIVLVASLLGTATAGMLAHVGQQWGAWLFLSLSIAFAFLAAVNRPKQPREPEQ